jgi:hypothetical protein
MYSAAIHRALANARIDELHRDARPIVSPRIAGVVKHQIHRCTSVLATYFRPTMPGAPIEKHA